MARSFLQLGPTSLKKFFVFVIMVESEALKVKLTVEFRFHVKF